MVLIHPFENSKRTYIELAGQKRAYEQTDNFTSGENIPDIKRITYKIENSSDRILRVVKCEYGLTLLVLSTSLSDSLPRNKLTNYSLPSPLLFYPLSALLRPQLHLSTYPSIQQISESRAKPRDVIDGFNENREIHVPTSELRYRPNIAFKEVSRNIAVA